MTTESTIKYEKITPVLDRILLKVINLSGKESKDTSQINLRDIVARKLEGKPIEDFETTKAMNSCGIVCSASPDCDYVADGDVVFFSQYAGTEIMIESQSHIMIRESDVLFILKP